MIDGLLALLVMLAYYVGWLTFNNAVVTLLTFAVISLGLIESRRG